MIRISISKQEVFTEVEKRTSLEGASMPEKFEDLWATEHEGVFMDSYWIEGVTYAIQLLKRYVRNASKIYVLDEPKEDDVLEINAEMPPRYDESLTGSIISDLKMMIACNVTAGWMGVKVPDRAEKYRKEAAEYAKDLKSKLLYRKEPKRDRMVMKGVDHKRITQIYDDCNDCIASGRTSEWCNGCCPCDR